MLTGCGVEKPTNSGIAVAWPPGVNTSSRAKGQESHLMLMLYLMGQPRHMFTEDVQRLIDDACQLLL